jgi:hypothetical protein
VARARKRRSHLRQVARNDQNRGRQERDEWDDDWEDEPLDTFLSDEALERQYARISHRVDTAFGARCRRMMHLLAVHKLPHSFSDAKESYPSLPRAPVLTLRVS